MKYAVGFISVAGALAIFQPATASAQMTQGGMMGGGRHGMINLVSPADSPTQIRRGTLMIGQYMSGMMGQNSVGSGTPAPGGNGTPGLRLVLRLYGVSDANGLITSTGNRLIFQGQLTTTSAGSNTPIIVDQDFVLNSGNALVQAPLGLPSLAGPATITIDQIIVADGGGNAFAVPGIALMQPTPQFTPRPTPAVGCTRDSDCDDGNADTRDLCMPTGCIHMPGHMGSGMPVR